MRALLAALHGTGATPDKIERFLNAEPQRGAGTVRDQMAAEMSNQLLDALGQPGAMSGGQARRLRERGAWRDLDRRPPDVNNFD